MVAIKAHQAAQFVKSPDPKCTAVLFYGTDAGLVTERAQQVARRLAERDDPPGEIIRIDETDLEQDPERLLVELQTVSMFGGRQVVRVTAGRRVSAKDLEALLGEGNLQGSLVIEAGNMRPADALRKLFERVPSAAAVACYADETQGLDGLVREVLGDHGLSIASDARQALLSRLGADRALSRGEVEKLALYARGKSEIDIDDVENVVGDASEMALDKIVNAAAAGALGDALRECDRLVASGSSPQAVIAAVQRHFLRLHRVRSEIDAGRRLDEATRVLRPPVHFKQKSAFEAQCRTWNSALLAQALTRITDCARQARLKSDLETILVERLLGGLAGLAAASRKSQAR